MADFAFYTERYLGEDIPEAQFPRYAKRAEDKLNCYRHLYRVSPRPGVEQAEDNALCAIADAMYEFDQEDARRGFASVSVGSVSESYTAPMELSSTTLYLRERYYRQVAGDFLVMQRGVRHG